MTIYQSFNFINKLVTKSPVIYQVRWSVWPPMYVRPIPRRENQLKLINEEPDKFKELTFSPIIAAPNDHNASNFYDPFLRRFVNVVHRSGRKAEYEDMIREVMYLIKKKQLAEWRAADTPEKKAKFELDPLVLMKKAVANVKPVVITKYIPKGGVTYSVPFPVLDKTSEYIGMKWINRAAHDHPKPWRAIHVPALVREFIFAFNGEGKAIKQKYDLHKLAETNKAYAHYRWD
ncbi:28S ribosomal protein S7, mitochondrial [Tetranychus urticae]|uniref:Small ribosomal subunit protein uS7 domain-containing protein n=1 Tax=Tetranychus urticae TaxID=32264 RepID=T1JWU9_TETUR|nr:28S ribosomal protein S7, mitochondrial [Tetranychus urticae]